MALVQRSGTPAATRQALARGSHRAIVSYPPCRHTRHRPRAETLSPCACSAFTPDDSGEPAMRSCLPPPHSGDTLSPDTQGLVSCGRPTPLPASRAEPASASLPHSRKKRETGRVTKGLVNVLSLTSMFQYLCNFFY